MKRKILKLTCCMVYLVSSYSFAQSSVIYNLNANAQCNVQTQTSQITVSGNANQVLNITVTIVPWITGSKDAFYYANGITFSNNQFFATTPNKKYWIIPKDPAKIPYAIIGGGSSATGDIACYCNGNSSGVGCSVIDGNDGTGPYKTCSGAGCFGCCSTYVETGTLTNIAMVIEATSINFNGTLYN